MTVARLLHVKPMAYWACVGFGHLYFVNCIRGLLDLDPISVGRPLGLTFRGKSMSG